MELEYITFEVPAISPVGVGLPMGNCSKSAKWYVEVPRNTRRIAAGELLQYQFAILGLPS